MLEGILFGLLYSICILGLCHIWVWSKYSNEKPWVYKLTEDFKPENIYNKKYIKPEEIKNG